MRSFSMLLVDDEPIILKGLKETFDWVSMGFTIVGTARDGREALEQVNELHPDVVVTDILMKNMDGIELINRCHILYPSMHFVVISAYRDFNYAQKACSLGVFSYLLKPLDDDQIITTMGELHDVLQKEYDTKVQLSSYKSLFEEQRYAIEARTFRRYLHENENVAFLSSQLQRIESTIKAEDRFCVACMDINISERILEQIDTDTQRFAMINLMAKKISDSCPVWCFELPDGRQIVILKCTDGQESEILIKTCAAYAETILKIRLTTAVAIPAAGFEGLKQSYMQAVHIYEIGSETGANVLTEKDELSKKSVNENIYPQNYEYMITHAIRQNDINALRGAFSNFVNAITDVSVAQLCYHRLGLSSCFFLAETYGLTIKLKNTFCNYFSRIEHMKLKEAATVLLEILSRAIVLRCEDSNVEASQMSHYVKNAQQYIAQKFGDENLSINDVARYLHLNVVYFGRLFKNRTGMSFKEFILSKRMETAMQLLDTSNKSVIDVANEVGIQNPSYFTQLFKQHTGKLPSEYKRK